MRINVYAEEVTDETCWLKTVSDTGQQFYGIRFYLKSHDDLHHTEKDDDRSAITIWVPWTRDQGHDFDLVDRLLGKLRNELGRAGRSQIQ
jgi:hypothetical protein